MMKVQNKRIVICCDGTWNTPDKPTNVVKIVRSLTPYGKDGKNQVVFYDQGVGTYNASDRMMGIFGKGIGQNIIDAYRFIAHNYQEGDDIYCFGFSRGAYTVRALGGMLHTVGLLPKDELHTLPQAYKYYRTPPHKREYQRYSHYPKPEIAVMAVWDTVGALGVPIPLLGQLTKPWVGFFDTRLTPEIKHAYQALAIDEKRPPFKPALWTGSSHPGQTIEQVWFAGCHSDIGGGYDESSLSDISLLWMIQKVASLGLDFDQSYLKDKSKVDANVCGRMHDSYSLPYRLMERLGGKAEIRSLEGELDYPAINVSIHESVLERLKKVDDYQPENLHESWSFARSDERRHFSRIITSQLTGEIQIDQQQTPCKILDYSPLGGARVQCDNELDKLEKITISSAKFAKTLATCAWKKDNIYGLNFAA
ncbi:DUF2235 domain-containing protein [Thalassomonas sp. RHCl1]|uniref:DUF2235 domain-containing protein n=1 Tax=Thalassomonas sp. RHCl1 TaxID=2995320 RepID=UPI00248B2EBE|nr:DUF2235 domain-containing protein [Thalassomonas sp. RHCl1]